MNDQVTKLVITIIYQWCWEGPFVSCSCELGYKNVWEKDGAQSRYTALISFLFTPLIFFANLKLTGKEEYIITYVYNIL